MSSRSFTQAVIVALLVGTAPAAEAALTVYASATDFMAAVVVPGVDGYDGLSTTTTTLSPLTRHAGAYGYTATTASGDFFFGAGTAADPALSTNTPTDVITFAGFTGGVSAIGGLFFTSDVGGALSPGAITLFAIDASGATASRTVDITGSASFIGFASDRPLSSLVVSAVQPPTGLLWPTVDSLTLAVSAVPEPSVALLLLAGIGWIGFFSRERKPGR